jgi:hypothetical protein
MSGRRVRSASFDTPNPRDPLRTYLHGAPGVLDGVNQHADAAALGAKQPSASADKAARVAAVGQRQSHGEPRRPGAARHRCDRGLAQPPPASEIVNLRISACPVIVPLRTPAERPMVDPF